MVNKKLLNKIFFTELLPPVREDIRNLILFCLVLILWISFIFLYHDPGEDELLTLHILQLFLIITYGEFKATSVKHELMKDIEELKFYVKAQQEAKRLEKKSR